MSWAIASVWIALFIAISAPVCLAIWTLKTYLEWRGMAVLEGMSKQRVPSLAGKSEPENFFDLSAEQERDRRNRFGKKPAVIVDNDKPDGAA